MRINKYSFPGLKFLESPELDKSFFNCDICAEQFEAVGRKEAVLTLTADDELYFVSEKTIDVLDKIKAIFFNDLNVFDRVLTSFQCNFEKTYVLTSAGKQILHIYARKIKDSLIVDYTKITNKIQFILSFKIDKERLTFSDNYEHAEYCKDGFILKSKLGCNHIMSFSEKDAEYQIAIDALTMLIFINFVDVETKVIGSSGKSLYIENEKVKNETNFNIKVLDKTWYTTVINSEGFPVKGHLRLQPVGEGRKDRKLIYIEPFEKNGYKREAGILKSKGLV